VLGIGICLEKGRREYEGGRKVGGGGGGGGGGWAVGLSVDAKLPIVLSMCLAGFEG
jgi:hypothetical protein